MRKISIVILCIITFTLTLLSQTEITLRTSFVDSLKNEIIYESSFVIDDGGARPNTAAKDGDIHIAGMYLIIMQKRIFC